MRESGGKRKETRTAERFPPKKTLLMEKILLQCLSGAFITKPPLQNTKKTKNKSYYKGQIGKKQKNVTKRSKRQKEGNVNSA